MAADTALLVCAVTVAAAPTQSVLVVMPSQAYLRLDGGARVRVGTYLDEVGAVDNLFHSGFANPTLAAWHAACVVLKGICW